MKKLFLIALATFTAANAVDINGWASNYEALSAFDNKNPNNIYGNRPGYVKPIIDNLGNVLNSNWFVSASVAKSLSFEGGLPVSLISTGDGHTYNYNGVEVPTIFGDKCKADINGDMNSCYQNASRTVYGNETLNGFGIFTYPFLQVGASMFHARVVLRGMLLPAVSELRNFSEFGFGLQYSFGHFFQYMLPPAAQPFDVSFVFGYNTSSIGYRPKDFSGQLDLDISTTMFSLVMGYKLFNTIEFLMNFGYQSAEMKSSGHLEQLKNGEEIYPEGARPAIDAGVTVKGNNGFRFGIAVAFQLGKTYHPMVGFDYAGKSSFTTNVLYFRQQIGTDKTPDEIAKDKGYVRGAKNSEETSAKESAELAPEALAESSSENQNENAAESEQNFTEDSEF